MNDLDTKNEISRYYEHIYLMKGSAYRRQVEGILRYSLHLDYETPLKNIDDPELVPCLKGTCKSICKQLTNGNDLIFFGQDLSDEINLNENNPEMCTDNIRSLYKEKKVSEKKQRFPRIKQASSRTTELYEIIFNDSIIEAFHILMHVLSGGIYATSYSILGVIDIYDVVKKEASINLNKYAKNRICKGKNSDATDMNKKWAERAKIPVFSQLAIPPESGIKAYSYYPIYSSVYNSLCKIKLNRIKRIFDPSRPYCYDDIEILEEVYKELITSPKTRHNNDIDKIYHCYLAERITNIGLFYSILDNIKYAEEKTNYRFGSQDVIKILSKLSDLPNALGRIPLVRFAFDYIPANTGTITGMDLMNRMDLSASLPLGLKMPFIPIESRYKYFTFERWLTQVDYMIFFLSNILIPVCSWYIVLMLLQTTENNMKKDQYDHKEVYAKAITVLGKYISNNADTIMHPIILPNTDRNKGLDLFTCTQEQTIDFQGLDSIGPLYSAFFKSGTPANLSPNPLSTDIFTDKENKDDDAIRYLRAHAIRAIYSKYLK